ncbi:MAG: hypothetical protein ABL901_01710 [Hyphomicrobiaceae bacterium]
MALKVLKEYTPPDKSFFLAVAAVKSGLSDLCDRFGIDLVSDRDDFDDFRYAILERDGTVFMIENYPRNLPDSYQILFLPGDANIRRTAQGVLRDLGVVETDIFFVDQGYIATTAELAKKKR